MNKKFLLSIFVFNKYKSIEDTSIGSVSTFFLNFIIIFSIVLKMGGFTLPDSTATKPQLWEFITSVTEGKINIDDIDDILQQAKDLKRAPKKSILPFTGKENCTEVYEYLYKCEEYFEQAKFNDQRRDIYCGSKFTESAFTWLQKWQTIFSPETVTWQTIRANLRPVLLIQTSTI
jgi:hypothetical protein